MFFNFPKDGDMLNEHDGTVKNGRLYVRARVAAHPESRIFINRIPAVYDGSFFTAEVPVDGYRNMITFHDAASNKSIDTVVYWLKDSAKKYRVSLDDNIWFLRDIAKNAGRYASVFDNPYLAVYKKAHDLYGAKVHANLYYQCEDFNLSMMPDTFKPEFIANADWLNFTFHALQNDPDKPYVKATYDQILTDYDLITNEIIRFAGEECLSPVTTVHWGECTREGVRALRARGIRCLMGYFRLENSEPHVSYYMDFGQTLHISGRNFWKDDKEDMIYGRISNVMNEGDREDIIKVLDSQKTDPHTGGFVELMIHEQYFYTEYEKHLPDYEQRVMTGVKWAADNGYEPAWIQDFLFEKSR